MTWTVNATGHSEDEDKEGEAIAAFRQAVADTDTLTATMGTAWHGQVDLKGSDENEGEVPV